MLDVGAAELTGCGSVVEERWEFGGDLGENILGRVNGQVTEVLLGEIVNQLR